MHTVSYKDTMDAFKCLTVDQIAKENFLGIHLGIFFLVSIAMSNISIPQLCLFDFGIAYIFLRFTLTEFHWQIVDQG